MYRINLNLKYIKLYEEILIILYRLSRHLKKSMQKVINMCTYTS